MIRVVLCLLFLPAIVFGAPKPLRMLMIGNSYTAQTKAEVKAFLDADPEVKLELVTHNPGGRFLEQHAKDPKVAKLLEGSGKWDVIVLQEQSQLPAFAMKGDKGSLERLEGGAPVLIPKILKAQPQARVMMFETWARHSGNDKANTLRHFDGDPEKMQEALTKGYEYLVRRPDAWDYSKEVSIVPVGQAFAAWYAGDGKEEGMPSLHRPDNSHPSKAGAYLTGAMFYRAITGRDPAKVSYDGGLQPDGTAEKLLKIAAAKNEG
ncbi:cell division protein FtsK [Haloferula helveola]|uniref:Cell division protein FtsK n=1 Tax=Haloferula helveola TaxID=490095 RepID=A0ABM7R9Z0_9BACT|nr:cell division protein FtsK [Haloferula helveola]